MFRNRSTRALVSLGITLSLAITAMAGPAAILGAQVLVETSATPVPAAVTPGANVAFDVHFKNISPSNFAQLFLDALTPDGATLVEVESQTQGACDISSGDLHCVLGALNSFAAVDLRIVYTTPTAAGTLTVPFIFNTTGVTSGDADRRHHSHGDEYPDSGTVSLDATLNYGGAYTSAGGQVVTDNVILSKRQNPQYTQVYAPEGGIAVTVGEATFPCPESVGTCFGQWSVISVNGGEGYSPDGFSVVLGYQGNIGNAKFVHVLDDGTVVKLAECSDNPAPVAERDPGCYFIDASGSNTIVTIWLVENGRLTGY
jgi:hypothetical protein